MTNRQGLTLSEVGCTSAAGAPRSPGRWVSTAPDERAGGSGCVGCIAATPGVGAGATAWVSKDDPQFWQYPAAFALRQSHCGHGTPCLGLASVTRTSLSWFGGKDRLVAATIGLGSGVSRAPHSGQYVFPGVIASPQDPQWVMGCGSRGEKPKLGASGRPMIGAELGRTTAAGAAPG